MSHDDGKKLDDILLADIILLGVSRTSKTLPIYLNRGYKTINIPLVLNHNIPDELKSRDNKACHDFSRCERL